MLHKRISVESANNYSWCIIDESGRRYAAYSESDAYMVQGTVGGVIYRRWGEKE